MKRTLPSSSPPPAWLSLACRPAAPAAQAPASFAGMAPQGADRRARLRADGEQRRVQRQAADVLGRDPAGDALRLRTRLRRLRPRRPPRRRTRDPRSCPSSGARRTGRRRRRSTLPVATLVAALGLGDLPARRGRPLRPLRHLLGRAPDAALPADPQLGDLERGEHRHLLELDRARSATRSCSAPRAGSCTKATPAPGSCSAASSAGRCRSRPTRPPATSLSRLYRAGNVKRFFDGVALHPYVADAGAMRAQIRNLRRVMRLHHDAAHAALHDRDRLGLRQLRVALGARPRRARPGSSTRRCRCSSSTAATWRIGGVWWFSWADLNDSCQFCDSAGLLTIDREAKPAWYLFNGWTGGDPSTVPRAGIGDAESAPPAPSGD